MHSHMYINTHIHISIHNTHIYTHLYVHICTHTHSRTHLHGDEKDVKLNQQQNYNSLLIGLLLLDFVNRPITSGYTYYITNLWSSLKRTCIPVAVLGIK